MSACFNCRSLVPLSAESCPRCGVMFTPGTLRSPLSGLPPRDAGWGASPALLNSRLYQCAALLLPFWGPALIGALGGNVIASALLLSPFWLIPALHLIGRVPGWGRLKRVAICLGYVVACLALWVLQRWV
jgi:hypothetical protein